MNSFYAVTVDCDLSAITIFLFLDFVLRIILQHGHLTDSVSSHTSHQLHRFNPNSYFCEFGILVTFSFVHTPLHDAHIQIKRINDIYNYALVESSGNFLLLIMR